MEFLDKGNVQGIGFSQTDIQPFIDKHMADLPEAERKAALQSMGPLVSMAGLMGAPVDAPSFAMAMRVIADALDQARPYMQAMKGMADLPSTGGH